MSIGGISAMAEPFVGPTPHPAGPKGGSPKVVHTDALTSEAPRPKHTDPNQRTPKGKLHALAFSIARRFCSVFSLLITAS